MIFRQEGGRSQKLFCPQHFLNLRAINSVGISNFAATPFTMASVYKTVSKKAARQLAKEQEFDEEDIEMDELLSDANDTTDSEEDEETTTESAKKQLAAGFMPKTRVLMLTSRGVTYRYVGCACGFQSQNQ